MPARHFDRVRVRAVRRAAEITQVDVAAALGAADSTVAGWETGANVPDQEKLPALAQVLKQPLDELFPRDGLPDLTDLRCDAGLYRYETRTALGTKSDGPVTGAEQGVRRLRDKYVSALAEAYGVTEDELRRAQERSFGEAAEEDAAAVEEAEAPPQTLAEKITLLLERSYPAGTAPGDEEIAEAVNAYAGSQVTTAADVEALRTGIDEAPAPVVLEGLAEFLGVSRMYFQPDDAVARQVYEGLRLMSAARQGKVGRVRARGIGSEGLPAEVLSILNDLATELDKKADPDADG
ncbi:helix-turn-helix transcriptional regulator [Streptomyces scabiei]|uniref:helix-turn-helix transcriptional regulator n=1 Tax=Streptomyces scabiei TaxID=1930 RepID=UPI0029B59354|nr:helix-turn-helix transcriptional regulator [Streptomyces scabiei]MDX2531601.1 helix-turn-helix transcriptional regulator [Streptomyces scabiei]MDX2796659.1 helix-turn-helix transcriptional regulator [Streptomyces scabiei]MDX2856166.1 helix-turn-helix transcriptional regulator [Streptomyces scabiei]MDX3824553.1 helix-turn-helix transcriptional regulator [Streptomyces scabiei]